MQDRLFERETFAQPLDRSTYRRPLVLAPHPDDEVYGCGGLLALWAADGVKARVVLVTGGQAQGDVDRHAESRSAATLLGYTVESWGLGDRALRCDEDLIGRVHAALVDSQADVVLAPALTETHPDHQALTLALCCALSRINESAAAPDVLLFESGGTLTQATVIVDITAVRELKDQAMAAFESQESAQPYRSRIGARDHFRALQLGPQAQAAEAFTALRVRELGWPAVVPAFEPLFLHARGQAARADDVPKVSVLVRTVGDAHLERTLASVAAQTYPRLEVVLVAADGAKEPPAGLPQRQGIEIRWVSLGRALSRPQAANAALDAAHGQWLIFLDDDDLWTPEHVQKLMDARQAHGQARAVHTDARVIDAQGHELTRYDQPWSAPRMAFTNVLPIHTVLFDAELVRRDGCRFDESLPVLEDWDFWMQVTQHTEVPHVAGFSALYRYRDRSGLQSQDHAHHHRQWRERVQARWLERLGPEAVMRAAAWYAQALDEAVQRGQAMALKAAQPTVLPPDPALEQKLKDTQAELEDAGRRLAQAVFETTAAQAQQKVLEGQVQDLREFAADRARTADGLREALTRAELKLHDTQAELQAAGRRLAQAVQEASTEQERAQARFAQTEALLHSTQAELKSAGERLAAAVFEATLAQERLQGALAELASTRGALEQAQRELKAQGDLADTTRQVLLQTEGLLNDTRAELQTQKARLESRVEELQRSIEAIRRSTSWRMTAPLRWLGRLMRPGRSERP